MLLKDKMQVHGFILALLDKSKIFHINIYHFNTSNKSEKNSPTILKLLVQFLSDWFTLGPPTTDLRCEILLDHLQAEILSLRKDEIHHREEYDHEAAEQKESSTQRKITF